MINESVCNIENEYLAQLRKKLTIHGDPNIPDKFLDGEYEALKKLLLDLLKPEIPHDKHCKLADEFNDTYSRYNYIYNKAIGKFFDLKVQVANSSYL